MQEHIAQSPTPATITGRSLEAHERERGHTATFYFPDGSRLVVAVADAVAFSCGGGDGETRLEVLDLHRRVIARGNLAALLRRAAIG